MQKQLRFWYITCYSKGGHFVEERKNDMKRILSLLLALTLCLGMLPANAWADAAEEPTGYVEETEHTEETESTEETAEATLSAEPAETEGAEEEPVQAEQEVVETEAADAPETVTLEPITELWINPEYRDLFSEADIGVSDISGFEGEGTQCSSPEEVIAVLREGLVNREENPTATLVTTTAYHAQAGFLTGIQDRLFDHTGTPTEGDYLRRDIGYSEISMGYSGITQDGATTWTYTFVLGNIKYFTTASQEQEMDREVSRVLSSLNLAGKSQKGKIDAIYDYLIHNVKYVSDEELADDSNVIKYSSYAALVQHNAVCQGFAGAFYRLCLESGIDSRIVSSDRMNHAWNIVELDGSYYHLDATWDINWPNAPKYYLRGTTYWKAEHRSSTTNYISELGDQFDDGSFAAAYPVPEGDYREIPAATTVTVTVVDGSEMAERELTVGRSYFSYDLALREDAGNRTLAGLKISKENGTTRTITEGSTGDEINVQAGDTRVELLWYAKQVTIQFYRNAADGAELIGTVTIRAGEAIESLPLLDGEKVDWRTEDGTLLEAGKVYDFPGTTVRAYPEPQSLLLGDCGENLKWVFDRDSGSLTIHGTGDMWNFSGDAPWAEFQDEILRLDIQPGVGSIGAKAFDGCSSLTDVYYNGTLAQWQAIQGHEQLDGKNIHTTADSYTVSFDPNGGTGSLKDMNAKYEANLTLPKSGVTRTGYSFTGWNTEPDGTGNGYAPGQRVSRLTEDESITLYAQWQANTYNIRFAPNGGTGKMPDQKEILYGETTELSPCAFTRKGYRFTGWNTKANGTGETVDEALNLTATNKGTVTLYAQWEGEPYDVTFHFGEETRTQTLHYGTAEALDGNTFENPGYTFKCWTTLESGKGKSYKDGAKVTNLTDTDLYAQWTANKYTVLFHSNLAKDTTKKQTLTYDGKETALTANSFSWKGHAFQGWAETRDAAEPEYTNKGKVRNLTTEKTIDLYAVWKVNKYTVVFDPNGAEGEEITQAMTYDVPAELEANCFERQGYTFQGWATTAKGKAVHRDGKEVKNLTDKDGVTLRLYAVWAPTSYMVSFEPGEGATGTMKPVKMTYGKTYTLTGVSFKRANYTFARWRDAETGETYANKAKVSDLCADGGTVTLVAQWVPTKYAITYKNLSTWEKEKEDLFTSYNVLTEGLPGRPSRPGCEFGGWYLDSGCKKPFNGFENIAKPGKLTLYPKWIGTPSKYTLHFDPGAEDVTGKMADKKNLVCGKDYTLAACAFKRPGWQFAGWECGSAVLDNKAKFSNLPAYLKDFASGGTVTLTAKWVQSGDGGEIPLK